LQAFARATPLSMWLSGAFALLRQCLSLSRSLCIVHLCSALLSSCCLEVLWHASVISQRVSSRYHHLSLSLYPSFPVVPRQWSTVAVSRNFGSSYSYGSCSPYSSSSYSSSSYSSSSSNTLDQSSSSASGMLRACAPMFAVLLAGWAAFSCFLVALLFFFFCSSSHSLILFTLRTHSSCCFSSIPVSFSLLF
jgi:hypothetical protein